MRPRICVSISPTTSLELDHGISRATALSADLVEIRLENLHDGLRPKNLEQEVDRIPLIATHRPSRDPDHKDAKERVDSLFHAVDVGFEFVDVELSINCLEDVLDKLREKGAKIILSAHDYSKTPSRLELESILAKMASNKPDVSKLVTTAQSMADNLAVLNLLEERSGSMPLVCLAMGKHGTWSRILAPFYGAPFTYASLEPGKETAPGQPSITELRQIYRIMGDE